MTTKILAIVGGLVVLLAVGGGAFYGGIVYEQQQAASLRNSFFAQRGGNGAGGTGQGGGTGFGFGGGAGGTGQGGGNGGAGRGTAGQIKSIDGNTITVSTPQDVVTVTVSDSTMISKTVTGTIGDLKVGDTIVVRGQRDASGNVVATNIQEGAFGGFGQGGQGQGPTPTAKP